jgi:hypothetical protein
VVEVTGERRSGRLIPALAALIVCAELAGTIAFVAHDRSQQVVEAAPTPLPQAR